MMLIGSVAGGYLAQLTNLGVTYVARAGVLIIVFVLALVFMHDLGFTPQRGVGVRAELKQIVDQSVQHGLKVPAIRATMLSGFFVGGVGIYVFYALQPYLLELWGDPRAYGDRRTGRGDRGRSPDRRRPADPSRRPSVSRAGPQRSSR